MRQCRLGRSDVGVLAAPGPQRGGLQRAAVAEGQRLRRGLETPLMVHLLETARGLFIAHAARQEHHPGDLGGHVRRQRADRRGRDRGVIVLDRAPRSRHDHVHLQQGAREIDAVMRHLGVQRVEGVGGGRFARGEIVVAVHEDLGLDDRHDPGLLAEGGVAGHRMTVRDAGERRGQPVADDDRGAPFREACAQAVILGEAFPQPVEALGDRFAGEGRERLGAGVHLDPGDHALDRSSTVTNGVPSSSAWRIVSSNRITPLMCSPNPGVVNSSWR